MLARVLRSLARGTAGPTTALHGGSVALLSAPAGTAASAAALGGSGPVDVTAAAIGWRRMTSSSATVFAAAVSLAPHHRLIAAPAMAAERMGTPPTDAHRRSMSDKAPQNPFGQMAASIKSVLSGGTATDGASSGAGDDASAAACGPDDDDYDSDEDMVPMVDPGTGEWGGPTKGGTMPEPTRFGDWERNGRCTDF